MTQPTVSLLLGVHNHQPVDNWDHVIEEATEKCYRPFLELLYAYPAVRMSVHYTGYLLDWLVDNHPALITLLQKMVERRQVEFFTGGMYEPILSIIPDADKVQQIETLTARIKELFGVTPVGMWQAERVWEPHLVRYLGEAGVRYLCLDDSHFKSVGLDEEALLGRYTSEEQGVPVDIFPISKPMRYLIPYADPGQIMDYLRSLATPEGNRAAVYFDDGEKFGVWPGTYKAVYQEKWLERFFQAIEANQDVVRCQLYSDYTHQTAPLGRVYLPTASYSEMLTWALPAQHINALDHALHHAPPEYERFLRGGFWRYFLVKYPESNNLHKKMLHVSTKVRQLVDQKHPQAQAALTHLWKGQSNDAFWHGVFGGLYLTNLRSATYKHLLLAENLADAALQGNTFATCHTRDFDCDGQPEILVETAHQNLYLDPDEGGGLFELDYRPKAFNLLDTLSRRYEPYHDKLAHAEVDDGHDDGQAKTIHDRVVTKERGLENLLHYDPYRRLSLMDHFFAEDTTLDKLFRVDYGELGDFVANPYQVLEATAGQVTLARHGHVQSEGTGQPVCVQKTLTVAADSARTDITYRITNESPHPLNLWFAVAFHVNLLAPDAPDRYYRLPVDSAPQDGMPEGSGNLALAAKPQTITDPRMVSRGELEGLHAIELVDDWLGLVYRLGFDRPTTLWRFPIETVSQSEAGFERVYQASALYPSWKFTLAPGQSEVITLQQILV